MAAWIIWILLGVITGWIMYRLYTTSMKVQISAMLWLVVLLLVQIMMQVTPVSLGLDGDCVQVLAGGTLAFASSLVWLVLANPVPWSAMA